MNQDNHSLRYKQYLSVLPLLNARNFETVIRAELWGLLKGVELAWNIGIRNLQVEVDSKEVIQAIEENMDTVRISPSLISGIKEMMRREWVVSLRHAYRETNQAADSLAKLVYRLPIGEHILENPLDD
ncbi:hypothetical protein DITRI_Ditri07aG0078100 [Diplodiscus trichospermus]